MRVKCKWNIGAYKAGTIIDLMEKEAYRLEKLGAVVVLRVAPGETMPEPDVAPEVAPGETMPAEDDTPEPEEEQPAAKRPGRPKGR